MIDDSTQTHTHLAIRHGRPAQRFVLLHQHPDQLVGRRLDSGSGGGFGWGLFERVQDEGMGLVGVGGVCV